MDASTEIRKLTPRDVNSLSTILDQSDQWKNLMSLIPKFLEPTFRCDVSPENPQKYNSDHFRLLEDESVKGRRKCTEILLSEWGTSGKIRPTVGHLLYLLVKAKLFRAADYVAVDLLHQEKPNRPCNGPEASISDFTDDLLYSNSIEEIRNIEQQIPDIVITDVDQGDMPDLSAAAISETAEISVTDMIEFSDGLIPLNVEEMACPVEIDVSSSNSAMNTSASIPSIPFPDIPGLNLNSENGTEPNPETPLSSEDNIPLPAISLLQNEYGLDQQFLPDFSGLGMNSNLGSITINISSQGSSDTSLHSPPCSSPLPALSLDTRLPHFNYSSLLTATNNFDVGPYRGENENGRLLGSGEFGSVFLAFGLLEKPVAVKKIFLGNAEVVSIDDEVTKQFRNEVEVLTKYKHENLLHLLGFSCDGFTYCLLYEYMPGGALKNRLQTTNVLQWKSRLNIAIGTSKAVSYLHTAFDTPLIHRDINSSNILLDSENNPKLSDFGLIKLIPNQNNAIATMVYGTSAYMAREAFGGDISVKLDTFSFGVVLLELITSLPPLDENRKGNDLVTHIEETVDDDNILPLVDHRAGSWEDSNLNYATKLFEVAQSCLKEKRKRPTMVEVNVALDELTKNISLQRSAE